MRINIQISTLAVAVPLSLSLGCTIDEGTDGTSDGIDINLTETDDGGPGQEDEAEQGGGTESGGSNEGPCTLDAEDGFSGIIVTCIGDLSLTTQFEVQDGPGNGTGWQSCEEVMGADNCALNLTQDDLHNFPDDEPAVMACCDPEGDNKHPELLEHCGHDAAFGVCFQILAQLQKAANDSQGAAKTQFLAAAEAMSDQLQNCYDQLQPNADDGIDNGGVFKLDYESTVLRNLEFNLTTDWVGGDWSGMAEKQHSCEDISDNDALVMEPLGNAPPSGVLDFATLSESRGGALYGPTIEGGSVFASASFVHEGSCEGARCPRLTLAVDANEDRATLDELDLYVDGATRVSNGALEMAIADVHIGLFGEAEGYTRIDPAGGVHHVVDTGAAFFFIGGSSPFETSFRTAVNTAPISIYELPEGGYRLDAFVIERRDSLGVWTVTVPTTTWN